MPTSIFQRDNHLAALYHQLNREILPQFHTAFHITLGALHCKGVSLCNGYFPCSCVVQMICYLNDIFSQWNKTKIYGTTIIDIVQDFAALSCIITVYSYSARVTYSNIKVFKKEGKEEERKKSCVLTIFLLLPLLHRLKSFLSNVCTQTRSLHGSKQGFGVFKSCVDLPVWHILAPSTW